MDMTIERFTDEKRLEIFKFLTNACSHLYSKNKLQEEKFMSLANVFADLTKNDPLFMAHLTAWANKQNNKDLKVLTVFFNSLNDADGTPFVNGGSIKKPNFRQVSYVCLNELDPHLALRVLEICHKKFDLVVTKDDKTFSSGECRHFSTGMRKAFKKYLRFREKNPNAFRSARNKGLSSKIQQLYRLNRIAPTEEAASALGWKQKNSEINVVKFPDFSSMTTSDIVFKLNEEKYNPVLALTIIPENKINAKVAKALLDNATGNQSIILYNYFSKNGFLEVQSINNLFIKKIGEANTAIDRIDTLSKNATVEEKAKLSSVRSSKRKEVFAKKKIGKVFVHIDTSSSMTRALDCAKEKGEILAECVNNPEENFAWGHFNSRGYIIPNPEKFEKEYFHQSLYTIRAGGTTDCVALYSAAREFGADVDVYITDQEHTMGSIESRLKTIHNQHNYQKPKAAVIIDYGVGERGDLYRSLVSFGIPCVILKPNSLTESALVAESISIALKGEMALVEEVLETPLPELPYWWQEVS